MALRFVVTFCVQLIRAIVKKPDFMEPVMYFYANFVYQREEPLLWHV
jgi:hypothetical protein